MNKLSAKNKIFVILAIWLVLCFAMFGYFFSLFDSENQKILDSMVQQRSDLAALKAESESYKQAQADLDQLAKQPYQPDNFFSQDIAFVNELSTLENWGQQLNVQLQLSGISGTVATALKAKTVTPIVMIPYGININGSFTQVIQFLEAFENLSFATNITSLSLGAADANQVNGNFSADFYLKK